MSELTTGDFYQRHAQRRGLGFEKSAVKIYTSNKTVSHMFHKHAFIFLFSTVLLSLIGYISSVNMAMGDNINPGIYSTDSSPKGVKYQEWTARFWQWLYSLAADQHPRENYTPEKCANGQKEQVWFLDWTYHLNIVPSNSTETQIS